MDMPWVIALNSFAMFCFTTLSFEPKTAVIDTGTLTVSRSLESCSGGEHGYLYGLDRGAFGSYSPSSLTGGYTVHGLVDVVNVVGTCLNTAATLVVAGFSHNPGSRWLISITCNGAERDQTNVLSYSYRNGLASWSWTDEFGLAKYFGLNVHCIVTHN